MSTINVKTFGDQLVIEIEGHTEFSMVLHEIKHNLPGVLNRRWKEMVVRVVETQEDAPSQTLEECPRLRAIDDLEATWPG